MDSEKILNKRISDNDIEFQSKGKVIFQGISFYLKDSVFAMDVMNIKSIINLTNVYSVPNTTEKLLGVLNLRGEILPIYSLKLILGMDEPLKDLNFSDVDEEKFIIIIEKDKDVFGILIDSIYKNIIATEDNFKEEKYLSKWSNNYLFSGVILEIDKEILVIKIDNLLKYMVSLK